VKAFEGQGRACAEYLSAGREIGIEGRLRFDEFETSSGDYATRVYIVADQVEFLVSRRAGSPDNGQQADKQAQPAAVEAGDEIDF
jgi:single-strand DNA-binding protein